jgi:glycosyltransferase involved in cell wall biosynthesis
MAAKRPRVCIVRQTDHYELPIQREAEALLRAGFDVEVIGMRGAGAPREQVLNGVRLTTLPTSLKKGSKLRYVFDYARFFGLVSATLTGRHLRRRYAAIQVNTMPDFLVFSAAVPKLLGARVVAYMHEPSPELAETIFGPGRVSRILARVEQSVLRFADHAVAVTDQLKARYVERGARADKITVVLNGVDPADRLGDWKPIEAARSDGKFRVICHGTIEDRYGQDVLVEAARLLRDDLPDLEVVLAGRGKAADRVLDQIRSSGLEDVVRFEGWVSHERLNDLLYAADVGVVAQKASPYSHLVHTNKMVDYWIFGLPVIASRLRAVSELYDDTVLEYYRSDDPADLAQAIRRLHGDHARREELARNGRLAQEQFGWAAQQPVYLGVFRALLNGRRSVRETEAAAR